MFKLDLGYDLLLAGTLRTFLESLAARTNRPCSDANLPLDNDIARKHFGIDVLSRDVDGEMGIQLCRVQIEVSTTVL